jgi:TolB-like protein/Tfp pilus assembly protein PilF
LPATEDLRPSIAVLPLQNFSPAPEDAFFANGIQEDITTALASISSLSVRGRSSVEQFRDDRPSIQEMASALGVDFLLEGSARIVGGIAKVTVQLIDGRLDDHIWQGEWEVEYKLEEAIRIQGEIAQGVASRLRIEVAPEEERQIGDLPTSDLAAHRLYHEARYLWNKRSESEVRRSAELFQRAIGLDPDYAQAYVGLADAYIILVAFAWETPAEGYPPAIAAMERALALDPALADAHVTLGGLSLWYDRDWIRAEEHFLQGLRLNPDHVFGHYWYGAFLDGMGRYEEAEAQMLLAWELDPLAPQIGAGLGHHYWAARQFDKGIDVFDRVLDLHPDFASALAGRCLTYASEGLFEEALASCRQGEAVSGLPSGAAIPALISALQGNRAQALQELARIRSIRGPGRMDPMQVARIFVALGDVDEALRLIRQARDEVRPYLHFLTYDLFFDPIRSDPRFIEIMEGLNLPIIKYQ